MGKNVHLPLLAKELLDGWHHLVAGDVESGDDPTHETENVHDQRKTEHTREHLRSERALWVARRARDEIGGDEHIPSKRTQSAAVSHGAVGGDGGVERREDQRTWRGRQIVRSTVEPAPTSCLAARGTAAAASDPLE